MGVAEGGMRLVNHFLKMLEVLSGANQEEGRRELGDEPSAIEKERERGEELFHPGYSG